MTALMPVIGFGLLLVGADVQTDFVQVSSDARSPAEWRRTEGRAHAVVLIHGLRAHPFSQERVGQPGFQDWQRARSTLVEALAPDADVFDFAYGQDVKVDSVAASPGLVKGLAQLRALGYPEVTLVGHSAGGLVARQFVEDQADACVTKVIQVCCPNGGSSWGKFTLGVRSRQEIFLESLTKDARQLAMKERAARRIPDGVEFLCVVGKGAGLGDGVVATRCQWTDDLQAQGIPMVSWDTTHFLAMRTRDSSARLAGLVRAPQPRWSADRVREAREQLFGR